MEVSVRCFVRGSVLWGGWLEAWRMVLFFLLFALGTCRTVIVSPDHIDRGTHLSTLCFLLKTHRNDRWHRNRQGMDAVTASFQLHSRRISMFRAEIPILEQQVSEPANSPRERLGGPQMIGLLVLKLVRRMFITLVGASWLYLK